MVRSILAPLAGSHSFPNLTSFESINHFNTTLADELIDLHPTTPVSPWTTAIKRSYSAITMLLLGLTGSIATGKSNVSKILSQPPYSLPIIDADLLARRVVEPGTPGYKAIVTYFQPSTPDLLLPTTDALCEGKEAGKDGKGRPINRAALGRRVFGTDDERVKARGVLNGIVHPAVRKEIYKALISNYVKGSWAVVLDVPLLFESKWDVLCGTVLVVSVSDPKVQIERLRGRDSHLTAEDAENRVRSQGDVRVKARRCVDRGVGRGVLVVNDGDRDDLRAEVGKAMMIVREHSPAWWDWLLWILPPVALASAAWTYRVNLGINKRWEEEELKEKAKL